MVSNISNNIINILETFTSLFSKFLNLLSKFLLNLLESLTFFINKLLELFASILFNLKKVIGNISLTFPQFMLSFIILYFSAKFVTFDKTGLMFNTNVTEFSKVFTLFLENNTSIYFDFLKAAVSNVSNFNFLQSENARLLLENQELRSTLANYQTQVQNSQLEIAKLESELSFARTEKEFFKTKAADPDLIYKNSIYPPERSSYISYLITFIHGASTVYHFYNFIFNQNTDSGLNKSDRQMLATTLSYARAAFTAASPKQTFSSDTDLLNDLKDKSVE